MNIFIHRKTKFTIATPGRLYTIYIAVILKKKITLLCRCYCMIIKHFEF